MDEDSAQWISDLQAAGPVREDAHIRLHTLLLRVARHEARRRSGTIRLTGVELDDIAYQAAADAMLAVLAELGTFRGDSRFTTWAYKFVVFELSAKIGQHFWTLKPTVPLDEQEWERIPARLGFSSEREAEWQEMFRALRRSVEEDLTEHQRVVFTSIMFEDVPLDILCARCGATRNAVYKTLFDARRKLRAGLVARGHLPEEPT